MLVTFRSKKKLDLAKLHNDISECFSKIDLSTIPDINDLISKYNIPLTEIYDALAPIQSRWLKHRRYAPWYSNDLRQVKHEKRRLERKYRKSGLTVDKQLFEDKCLEMYQPSRTLRSASHSLRCPQKAKTENCGCRAFSFVAPKLWNSLPEDIKNAKTVICFKNKLQTHLFRNAFLF